MAGSPIILPFFSMGLNTYEVPADFHKNNRIKLMNAIIGSSSPSNSKNTVVFLVGGTNPNRNDTDHEPIFRQESYFHYLFGVKEPDFVGLIHIQRGHQNTVLFIPRLPSEYATFMGAILTPDEYKEMYQVDECYYVDEVTEYLKKIQGLNGADGCLSIMLLEGLNTDSGNMYSSESAKKFIPDELGDAIDIDTLFPLLVECRVIKSEQELQLMRHVAELSSDAHVYVMRECKPGMAEWQLEALFRHYVYFYHGCRQVSYTPICACGPNSSVLHYGHAGAPNSRQLEEADICLMDMGTEYHCYSSDITCSFPANGKFSSDQRIIYEGVLEAQRRVYAMLRPGVSWMDCHKVAEVAIIRSLLRLGVLCAGDISIDDLVEERIGGIFMPHGLGHFIGIDTHDVGGYLDGYPKRSKLPGLRSLRTARIVEENMVLTVEPGCYFIDHLLDEALNNDRTNTYLVRSRIDELRGIGGVRLEDVVVITKDGCNNFTCCPRTVSEVEHVMAGGKWPPVIDKAPELYRSRLVK